MNYPTNLRTWDLTNRWVIVRIDGNVTIHDDQIIDDFRLQKVLPTLSYIIQQGGRCIILTHRGRPEGRDLAYTTKPLSRWFSDNLIETSFVSTIDELATQQHKVSCIVLENTRFYGHDNDSDIYFKNLSDLATYYVFDGWGVAHRQDRSLIALPLYFKQAHRSIGFLVENELKLLQPFYDAQDSMMILGGGKAQEKLRIVAKNSQIRTLFLLPLADSAYEEYKEPLASKKIILCRRINDLVPYRDDLMHETPLIVNGFTPFYQDDYVPYKQLLQDLMERKQPTLLCGGDTVHAALKIAGSKLLYSTGGGSTLAYLAHQPLYALEVLNRD